jgi:hypothetical protein
MKLTRDEIALLSLEGFNERFESVMGSYPNQRAAYEALEGERMELLGQRYYRSFENFKSVRSRYLNRKLTKSTGNKESNQ